MTGFFKKLLGKKDEIETPQDDGGSWTEHEISVEIREVDENQDAEDNQSISDQPETIAVIDKAIEKVKDLAIESVQTINEVQPVEAPTADVGTGDTKAVETLANNDHIGDTQPVETLSEADKLADRVIATRAVNIATLNEADLKNAMDQYEPPKEADPLDEITSQIQAEIAAERTAEITEKQKIETLDKLIEITNQLKRPAFDEDFDV